MPVGVPLLTQKNKSSRMPKEGGARAFYYIGALLFLGVLAVREGVLDIRGDEVCDNQ